jgi:hypothetical protein
MHLLDEVKIKIRCRNLKKEALDHTMCRTDFRRGLWARRKAEYVTSE